MPRYTLHRLKIKIIAKWTKYIKGAPRLDPQINPAYALSALRAWASTQGVVWVTVCPKTDFRGEGPPQKYIDIHYMNLKL